MICGIALTFGLVLIYFGAVGNVVCQNTDSKETTSSPKLDLRGKRTFEAKCATCHGLDGLGGEHAPDIIRPHDAKELSDEALLNVIHDGILEAGCLHSPASSEKMGRRWSLICAFCKADQWQTPRLAIQRGAVIFFFGKAGCSACHQIAGRERFAPGDLAGFTRDHFARDHSEDEIRDAILKPSAEPRETAIAVARNGRSFSGMIRNEDNTSLQLQDGDGRFYLLNEVQPVLCPAGKLNLPCLLITASWSAAVRLMIWSLTLR